MSENFATIILGGTGQVGGATVAELLAIRECREVVMVTRKPIAARSRVRNVVLDTGAADFAVRTADLAREVLSRGPAPKVSLRRLSRDMAREKLNLFELPSYLVTKPGAGPSQIVWRDGRESAARSILFHNRPDYLSGEAPSPDRSE